MGLFDIFRKKKYELAEAELKWNKIWELWTEEKAESPYGELMTYQSEINNGGHSQYFNNVENTGDIEKEMYALEKILSENLMDNLKKAYKAYLVLEKKDDEKSEEIFDECDDVFYENEAEINDKLRKYAARIEL